MTLVTLVDVLIKGLWAALVLVCFLVVLSLIAGAVVGLCYGAYHLFMFVIFGQKWRCKIVGEEHYGEDVWVNKDTETLRKKNCLCLQCAKMKPALDNCPYAQVFYENCKRGNIALMVTRCRGWQPKEK